MRIEVLLLVVACSCAGVTPLPSKAVELNQSGARALAEGDLEIADARLNLALEYSPHFVEALINLGLVECQRGNFARARQLLQRARRLNPDVAQGHHALGLLAEREQLPSEAAQHYREALRVDPGFAAGRANLARLQFDAGEFEQARVSFRRLVQVAPDDPEGHVGLAETLLQLGRYEEAAAEVAQAVLLSPKLEAVQILQARELLRQARCESAIAALTPLAAQRDDWGAAALAWLATAELVCGRPRRAIGAAERALALEPEHPVATLALARALDLVGDASAQAWAERAEQLRGR